MRRIPFLLIATVVIYAVVCLPLSLLLSWLLNTTSGTTLALGLAAAIPLALIMWFVVQSSNLLLKWPLLQLIGLTTILLSVLVIASPLHLFFDAPTVGAAALVLWIAATAYAVYAAQSIKNTSLTISSQRLARSHRLVHLSDLHAGSRSPRFIGKAVSQAMSHQPDFVVITGDLLDSSAVDKAFLTALSRFDCPVWMSLGNHERYVQLQDAIDAIEHQGVTVLRDTSVDFNQLQIIGVDDTDNPAHAAQQLATIAVAKNRFSVLLYHRPDGWSAARHHGIDLMLAGHTHAGQIWPFGLLVKRQFPQMNGYFSLDNQHLYVSQGTGTWGPTLRFGTRCEMTVIDLKPDTTDR